jgi:hypothetical protein
MLADILAGVGLLALGVGLAWWVHPGAGLAVGGLALFALGLKGAWER